MTAAGGTGRPVRNLTGVGMPGLAGRWAQTQGRRLENALADSEVGSARCSRSMRVMRRNSSRYSTVVSGDDGLLVGFGGGHRIAQAQLALFDEHGVAESQQFRVFGQPVGHLDPGDFGAAVQVVEVAPLLAGGEAQGEADGQVAGPVEGGRSATTSGGIEE